MYLIVTIPAFNEEATIDKVIKSIPKRIPGIKKVKVLVWDDGSTDKTAQIAKKAGADFIFFSKKNLGLARTFDLATTKAVELGADIIVNTDADNQYDQAEIPKLIKPILAGKADVVNGNRQVEKLDHMPSAKKFGNMLGSWVIRLLTGLRIQDASSGFRAYTRGAIKSLTIFSNHTYTHETLIQASYKGLLVTETIVKFKKRRQGQSKLITSVWSHIKKSSSTIVRTILMYKAFKLLVGLGILIILIGFLGIARFLYFYLYGDGSGHVQSLIMSSIFISVGFNTLLLGVIADLIGVNREYITSFQKRLDNIYEAGK